MLNKIKKILNENKIEAVYIFIVTKDKKDVIATSFNMCEHDLINLLKEILNQSKDVAKESKQLCKQSKKSKK